MLEHFYGTAYNVAVSQDSLIFTGIKEWLVQLAYEHFSIEEI